MKQDNSLWGCHRIADELKELGIELNPTTVNRIIQKYREEGKIKANGSWKKFLKSHWDSQYAMDFMTIDTLFGKRFYLFIILELKSRKIVRYDLNENPCREFVKQRIELISEKQIRKILKSYVEYYNRQRPHQGLGGLPDSNQEPGVGDIQKAPVLGGLHHTYYRCSA